MLTGPVHAAALAKSVLEDPGGGGGDAQLVLLHTQRHEQTLCAKHARDGTQHW